MAKNLLEQIMTKSTKSKKRKYSKKPNPTKAKYEHNAKYGVNMIKLGMGELAKEASKHASQRKLIDSPKKPKGTGKGKGCGK